MSSGSPLPDHLPAAPGRAEQSPSDGPIPGYDVLDSRTSLHTGHVIDVRSDDVQMPDGSTVTRDVVVHPGAVGILALDDRDRVLLQGQFRHPVRRQLWEPPAGLLDCAGEAALAAARRELYEEAHLAAQRWHVLVDIFTSPGMCDEALRIFLARDLSEAAGERYVREAEEVGMPAQWVDLDDAAAAVAAGRLHNPTAAVGILAAQRARALGWVDLRPADSPWPEMSDFLGSGATPV